MSTTSEMKFTMVGNMMFLKNEFNGIVEKGGNTTKVLIAPVHVQKADGSTRFSFKELGEEIDASFKINSSSVLKAVSDGLKTVLGDKCKIEEIAFELTQFFFYSETGSNKKETEYAFCIKAFFDGALPDLGGILKLNWIGVAFWNTTRAEVVSRMNLGTVSELLPK